MPLYNIKNILYFKNPNFNGIVFIWRILVPNFPRHNNSIVVKYVAELMGSMMEKIVSLEENLVALPLYIDII